MSGDTAQEVQYEIRGRAAYVTINRPHRLNAISRKVHEGLVAAATAATEDPDVWLVVFRGSGGKAFSVGADLKDMNAGDSTGRPPSTPMTGPARNTFEAVMEIPKPTLASIDGYCLAGGFELAMACDLRVAGDNAVFGMPEARIGMGANFATVLLPRLVPRAVALEMLYLAERIDAHRALELSLVNKVVAASALAECTDEWVAQISTMAPLTLRRYKETTLKGWELPVSAALRLNVGPNPYTSEDRAEGVAAFLEKRTPNWQGR